MKVLLLTYGSRGDVQPFAALANALAAAGHEAVLGAPLRSLPAGLTSDVPFAPLHDAMHDLMNDPVVRAGYETNFRGLRGKALLVQVVHKFQPAMAQVLDDMAIAADKYGADLIVHHHSVPGSDIAEYLGVPAISTCLAPNLVPTKSFTNPMLPFRLPTMLNRASYLATTMWNRGIIGNTSGWRRETLGISHRRHLNSSRRKPVIFQAFSRQLLPASTRYPNRVHTTGFWFMPAPHDWRPPQYLIDFLTAGEPPVCIGFGSLIGKDPAYTARLVADAVRTTGVRAIVVTGWGGIPDLKLANNILQLDQAPFDWLFPRMAAIVHHGGSGTTGTAIASGRPQVICPFMTDQRFYAWRMHAIGVAPAPLPQPDLTADRLAEAIKISISDSELSTRSAELGYQIRAEDGVTEAMNILTSIRQG